VCVPGRDPCPAHGADPQRIYSTERARISQPVDGGRAQSAG